MIPLSLAKSRATQSCYLTSCIPLRPSRRWCDAKTCFIRAPVNTRTGSDGATRTSWQQPCRSSRTCSRATSATTRQRRYGACPRVGERSGQPACVDGSRGVGFREFRGSSGVERGQGSAGLGLVGDAERVLAQGQAAQVQGGQDAAVGLLVAARHADTPPDAIDAGLQLLPGRNPAVTDPISQALTRPDSVEDSVWLR
eukprot:3202028-Rhodomonas_salina.2